MERRAIDVVHCISPQHTEPTMAGAKTIAVEVGYNVRAAAQQYLDQHRQAHIIAGTTPCDARIVGDDYNPNSLENR